MGIDLGCSEQQIQIQRAMPEKKVLIVEDDAIISSFIEMKLEEMGYKVPAKARNGKDAIFLANLHQPDLILMDVMLDGDIDGIQTVEEITPSLDIPVIYLTAHSDESTIQRLMKTEPHGFIIKPFDDRVLSSAIHIAVHRHKTKKELFETKEMLKSTIASIDDLVFTLDANGVITHQHSDDKHPLSFFKAKNIVGRTFRDVFPREVAGKINESINWVKNFKKPRSIEFSLEEQGTKYWLQGKFTLRKDASGNTPGFTMVISDLSERKNMHNELVVSQEKLSEAQNIAKLGCCDMFFGDKSMVYNDLFFEILDMPQASEKTDFSKTGIPPNIHDEDKNRYQVLKKGVVEQNKSEFTVDYRVLDSSGNVKYIHEVGQVKYTPEGQPERMIITIQDISWQKNNEILRQEVELTKRTTEMKQKFLARLSHEIRNPIGGITGLLHLLEKTQLDNQQQEYTKALKVSSETLLNFLNDVLDFTKMESGMMKLKHKEFNIQETLRRLLTFYKPQAKEKELSLESHLADGLPGSLIGDENKIVQIISNLLSNALKFTQKGGVEIRVDYRVVDKENLMLQIEVEDSGPGISAEGQKKLFKDYAQLDNSKSQGSIGSGLGLAICKQLVDLMKGDIGLKSAENQGAIFWFSIPLMIAEEPTNDIAMVEKDKKNRKEPLNCSVLLVEDMVINQKVMKLMLEDMGCSVSIASNGQAAVEMYRETAINAFDIFAKIHYDIILMDQVMPVMDGVSALQKLKKDYEVLPPVVLLTADESFAIDDKYKEKGFNDCLIKPIRPEQLYDTLCELIKERTASLTQKKQEYLNVEDIEKKPVINKKTLDLIMGHAKQNQFNIELLFESFIDDMERIYTQTLSALEMNDTNALKLIIMTVKGLSGSIGASQVHATAKIIDRYIRNEQYEDATNLIPLLTEKYTIFKNKIEVEFLKAAEVK